MEKIKFVNNGQPAINDTNLNKMQDNIEKELDGEVINNNNGTAIKFSNGIMMCFKEITGTIDITSKPEEIYYIGYHIDMSLPAEFIEEPYFSNVIEKNNKSERIWIQPCGACSKTKWMSRINMYASQSYPNYEFTLQLIAIGRWK